MPCWSSCWARRAHKAHHFLICLARCCVAQSVFGIVVATAGSPAGHTTLTLFTSLTFVRKILPQTRFQYSRHRGRQGWCFRWVCRTSHHFLFPRKLLCRKRWRFQSRSRIHTAPATIHRRVALGGSQGGDQRGGLKCMAPGTVRRLDFCAVNTSCWGAERRTGTSPESVHPPDTLHKTASPAVLPGTSCT